MQRWLWDVQDFKPGWVAGWQARVCAQQVELEVGLQLWSP